MSLRALLLLTGVYVDEGLARGRFTTSFDKRRATFELRSRSIRPSAKELLNYGTRVDLRMILPVICVLFVKLWSSVSTSANSSYGGGGISAALTK